MLYFFTLSLFSAGCGWCSGWTNKREENTVEKKITRQQVRDAAFILIFESLFQGDDLESLLGVAAEVEDIPLTADVEEMFRGVMARREELDQIISTYSTKRAIGRIPRVSLAILRLALWEILYSPKMPMDAAISEAVLLAKKYAQEPDAQFVNGVLGAFSRNHKNEREKNGENQPPEEGAAKTEAAK